MNRLNNFQNKILMLLHFVNYLGNCNSYLLYIYCDIGINKCLCCLMNELYKLKNAYVHSLNWKCFQWNLDQFKIINTLLFIPVQLLHKFSIILSPSSLAIFCSSIQMLLERSSDNVYCRLEQSQQSQQVVNLSKIKRTRCQPATRLCQGSVKVNIRLFIF